MNFASFAARIAATSVLLTACTGNGNGDASIDSSRDAAFDAPPDAPACNGPMVEDLAALATPIADGVSYTGSNDQAPPAIDDNLQPAMTCNFRSIDQRLFAYTMRSSAALRVSTHNAGTDAAFDSAIFVTRAPCTLPAETLACNDDDPFAPQRPHVASSLATTPVLAAGTHVIIAVGGFFPGIGTMKPPNPAGAIGTFELTVREVQPVANGADCDPSGQTAICGVGSSCVGDPNDLSHTTCRPDGAMAGAACRGAMCDAPLACDTNANRCYATVAEGAPCDRLGTAIDRCADGFTCVSPYRGPRTGVCRANGSVALAACDANGMCTGAGLVCRPNPGGIPTCVQQVASGAACSTFDTMCPTGEWCVPSEVGAIRGVCTPNGTVAGSACREGDSECDGALFCIANPSQLDRACKTVGHAAGDACGTNGACALDWSCFIPDPTRPSEGTCAPSGTLGGVCNVATPPCGSGLFCSNTANPAQGRCTRTGGVDIACDLPARVTRCVTGLGCVRTSGTGDQGTCRRAGSVAGAPCRANAPRCDDGLTCGAGATAVCRRPPVTDECSPRDNSVACSTGTACAARSLDEGTCRAPVMESEPNQLVPATAQIATPVVVSGSLTQYDLDCFGVSVAQNGALFAQVTTFEGQCSASLTLDVYGPAGLIGNDSTSGVFGCPRVDGRDSTAFGWARGLAAGNYTVCLRQNTDRRAVSGYALSLDASP